jgi:hypothetical protein
MLPLDEILYAFLILMTSFSVFYFFLRLIEWVYYEFKFIKLKKLRNKNYE